MNGHVRGYVNGVIDGEFTGIIDGELGAVVRAKDTVEMMDAGNPKETPPKLLDLSISEEGEVTDNAQ